MRLGRVLCCLLYHPILVSEATLELPLLFKTLARAPSPALRAVTESVCLAFCNSPALRVPSRGGVPSAVPSPSHAGGCGLGSGAASGGGGGGGMSAGEEDYGDEGGAGGGAFGSHGTPARTRRLDRLWDSLADSPLVQTAVADARVLASRGGSCADALEASFTVLEVLVCLVLQACASERSGAKLLGQLNAAGGYVLTPAPTPH